MAVPTYGATSTNVMFNSLPNATSTGPAFFGATGNIFYVQSINPQASNSNTRGASPLLPYASLNYALLQVTPNNGDVIYVMPGHVEAVTGAAGLNFATGCDGVTVVFQGNGADRAQINLTTSTAAQVVIAANNVALINPKFVAGIDAVAAAVSVTGTDCTLINVEYFDATAIYTTIQVITTNAAKRFTINGYTYYEGTAGTTKTEAIRIVGGDHHRIMNLNITGTFSTSNFNNVTTATTVFVGQNWYLNNLNSATVPVSFVSTSTGAVAGATLVATTGAISSSFVTASNVVFDITSVGTIPGATGANGVPLGGNAGSGGELYIQGAAKTPTSGTMTLFTITGGPIIVTELCGVVTSTIQSQATTLKFTAVPTAGSATDVCATGDLNALAAGNLLIPVTSFATALPITLTAGVGPVAAATLITSFTMGAGIVRVTWGASSSGAVQFSMRYKALAANVSVVAN